MDTRKVLLVDTSATTKKLLEDHRLFPDSPRMSVSLIGVKIGPRLLEELDRKSELILFGEKVPAPVVARLARMLRLHGFKAPMLMLTQESEGRLPRNLRNAGVDDVLNIADIRTPLFGWSFVSTLTQVQERKKAREYDRLQTQLEELLGSLAHITHEVNNPLSVIRLALYQLENAKLPKAKRDLFFQLLVTNIEKVDARIRELYQLRRTHAVEPSANKKILKRLG